MTLRENMKKNGEDILTVAFIVCMTLSIMFIGDNMEFSGVGYATKAITFSAVVCDVAPTIDSYYPELNASVDEGSSQVFNITYSDACNDTSELTVTWYFDGSSLIGYNESFTYSPSYNDSGSHTINVTVSDGAFITNLQWDFTVNNIVYCGDNVCEGSESCSNCPGDCGVCPSGGGSGGSRREEPTEETEEEEPREEQPVPIEELESVENPLEDILMEQNELVNEMGLFDELKEQSDELDKLIEGLNSAIISGNKAEYDEIKAKIDEFLKDKIKSIKIIKQRTLTQDDVNAVLIDMRKNVTIEKQSILNDKDYDSDQKAKYDLYKSELMGLIIEHKVIELTYYDGKERKAMQIKKKIINQGKLLKNVRVIMNIPKLVAPDVSYLEIMPDNYRIVEYDPIVEWVFDEIRKKEVKDISVLVKRDFMIDYAEDVKLIIAIEPEVPVELIEEKKVICENVYVCLIKVVILLILTIFVLFILGKKKIRKLDKNKKAEE